jgi:hypothetical protein
MIITKSQAIETAVWQLAFFFLLAFGLVLVGDSAYMLIVSALKGIFALLMLAIIAGWVACIVAMYRACFKTTTR